MPGRPLFLARAVYRRRRLRDAARLLPLVGLLLMLLPILGREGAGDVRDAIYLFALWAALILVAAFLAPGLSASEGEDDGDSTAEPAPPPPEDAR